MGNPFRTAPTLPTIASPFETLFGATPINRVDLRPRHDSRTAFTALTRRRSPWRHAGALTAACLLVIIAVIATAHHNTTTPIEAKPDTVLAWGDHINATPTPEPGWVDPATLDTPNPLDLPPPPTIAGTTPAAPPADLSNLPDIDHPDRPALAEQPTHITVIGDSLTVGAADPLNHAIEATGVTATINAEVSRPTAAATTILTENPPPPGSVIVIALGTNDTPNETRFAGLIDDVMAAAPTHSRVIWLNLDRKNWEPINDALTAAADRHATLTIADWAAVAARYDHIFADDNIHYTNAGYQLRARFITNTALGLPTDGL